MQKILNTLVVAAAGTLGAQAAVIWQAGMDDNDWPLNLTGGGPNAAFVQETGTANPLPGSPTSDNTTGANRPDDDYYFAGVYTNALAGNGAYAPVGVVSANETGAERAFVPTDPHLRFHFNLPNSLTSLDRLTVTFDALNFHTDAIANPRYGVEVLYNGVVVMPQIVLTPADIDRDITTQPFHWNVGGGQLGAGFDNIVTLRGIDYSGSGGGSWMGIDYVRLDSQQIPEPSSAVIMMVAALGTLPALRRRRA